MFADAHQDAAYIVLGVTLCLLVKSHRHGQREGGEGKRAVRGPVCAGSAAMHPSLGCAWWRSSDAMLRWLLNTVPVPLG